MFNDNILMYFPHFGFVNIFKLLFKMTCMFNDNILMHFSDSILTFGY